MTTTKQTDDKNNKDNNNNNIVHNYWVIKLRPAAARCLQPKKDYKYVPNYDTLFSTSSYFIVRR